MLLKRDPIAVLLLIKLYPASVKFAEGESLSSSAARWITEQIKLEVYEMKSNAALSFISFFPWECKERGEKERNKGIIGNTKKLNWRNSS